MCDECFNEQPSLAQAIKPFLKEGVRVGVLHDANGELGSEDLMLETEDGGYVVITADGGDGGYFCWEVPFVAKAFTSKPEPVVYEDLGENVVHLDKFR